MSQLPLLGLNVVDLSRVLAGPLAAMQLGDLGANVIKVERSGPGDESRAWGPPWDARGESAYYLCCNRNKLSVAADLGNAADAAFVRDLIRGAHVVIENFLPGALARRGIDASVMLAERPDLVWCTIGGFASEPERPGYDYVVQAEAGWMSITGEAAGAPTKVGVALVDVLTGKEAVGRVLATVAAVRAGAAVDRHVRVFLHETAVAALVNVAQNTLVSGEPTPRWANGHPNLVPYDLFQAADRPLVIAVGNDTQFASLIDVLAEPALAASRFATNAGRVAHRQDVVRLVGARVALRAAGELLGALRAVGVPAGLVSTVADALGTVVASPLSGIAPAAPGTVRRAPPMLDQHGAVVREFVWGAFARA